MTSAKELGARGITVNAVAPAPHGRRPTAPPSKCRASPNRSPA
nr:hypothetical protein [Streptomyces atratus]